MELILSRFTLEYLLTTCSDYSDFRAYYKRFNYKNAILHYYHCNQDSSLDYFTIYKAISLSFDLFVLVHCPNSVL
jgi:hypothetical protein